MKECTSVRKALFRPPFAGWDNPVHQLDDDEIEERNKLVQARFNNWLSKSPVTIMSESEDFTNVLGDKVITLKVSLPQLDKGNLLNYY
tara:strand:- start:131 stop:394 length:264 start_codon:yes stop_codon:yes gene_type:complete